MNRDKSKYTSSMLVSEMLDTVEVMRTFDSARALSCAPTSSRILLTGEGSSRIFPAGRARDAALRGRKRSIPVVEGASQASDYELDGYEIYAASNSGRTAEVVGLVNACRRKMREATITAIVADGDSPLAEAADRSFVLGCGKEQAVAATKSVVEQALFYDVALSDPNTPTGDFGPLADSFGAVLEAALPAEIVSAANGASTLYFAGWNNGVAEELALKTNEITRKRSGYLEGTYGLHGIEEVMETDELVVLIDPREEDEIKYAKILETGVGLTVVAIASRKTRFSTIRVPAAGPMEPYLHLAAGWNLLVETGLSLGVNLDQPVRARKVGNELGS